MGPGALAQVLRQLPVERDPRLIVGIETADDAGVYLLDEQTALVQTLDFFSPIVDDPYIFGQIAAANSLSDVYAMGGRPLTAMNIVGFPMCTLGPEVLLEILRGGLDKVREAGAAMVGGHTIEDAEPKFGLSVTGVVNPAKILANKGACPGDLLLLTKAIGTGVLATAMRAEMFVDGWEAAIRSMVELNRSAAEVISKYPIHACTDITGFGLLGHLYEMASASAVDIEINSEAIPLLPEAAEAAAMGFVPAGAYANRGYLKTVAFSNEVPEAARDLCFDPQTSGGLLVSLPPVFAHEVLAELRSHGNGVATLIGCVEQKGEGRIYVR